MADPAPVVTLDGVTVTYGTQTALNAYGQSLYTYGPGGGHA